ncbi:TrbG/VirB9 family P-type conjugative transfer protein [Stagnihabitans tardus]|uniref:TrbG/VirB9 family P-type conjugative transfer protein n=1 Tax=Stagnihabitans tardus TaxID=2699202 RepID=A0AAE4YFD4_9RHOB|nr:TrbG/VirB9 family P-type conjugative transfer protein [Stagnihabitans tardus]NBZ89204.1 TrbG/VirB9 family P-type conjugative transfer protein [Stagnihabitans tardus]
MTRIINSTARMLASAATLATCLVLPISAETVPKAGSRDARVTYATFQEGQVYKIATRLRTVTLVELGDGERIQSIAIGDLESFKIDKLERPNLFIIKPVVAGAVTNLTVETQRSIYFLEVSEGGRAPAYSVKFTTPGNVRPASGTGAAAPIPLEPPMTYRILKKGRPVPDFAPTAISDDGQKTTFVIPPGAPMPTVFRADELGQEYAVNSMVSGTTITVPTRSERWVLRYGEAYVCITGKKGGTR